jgi:epsilon-lactone hydrolase
MRGASFTRAVLILLGIVAAAAAPAAGAATASAADNSPREPTPERVDAAGTVHVPALDVPISSYMSEQAKAAFIAAARGPSSSSAHDIDQIRTQFEAQDRPRLERSRAIYAADIREERIGGVRTRVITPQPEIPPRNRHRVLINLHGGAFAVGADLRGLIESLPLAGPGGMKVISVDYRQGPENRFPAASEDVTSVYRELLKTYPPRNIGIYGCSAGGVLAAMAAAWIQRQQLPAPGAIGIFSAGAFGGFYDPPAAPGSWGGDSRFTAPPLLGQPPVPANMKRATPSPLAGYLTQAELSDPLVSPALSAAVMAKFPPTLLLSGTRAYDMSAAVQTQRALTKAGVEADLHLWDGMGHCFFINVDLPESQEAFAVMRKFFDAHLGR